MRFLAITVVALALRVQAPFSCTCSYMVGSKVDQFIGNHPNAENADFAPYSSGGTNYVQATCKEGFSGDDQKIECNYQSTYMSESVLEELMEMVSCTEGGSSSSSSSSGGSTSSGSGEPKKTPTVYFNSLFTNWNTLTTKSKTCKESLRDQAETVLLSTADRNKLKSALTKGAPKKSLQFSTAITSAKFKEAAGMDTKGTYCQSTSGLETAVSYIYDAFVQGKADIESAGYSLDTSATTAYDSILATLTAAKTYVASASLGQETMTEQNPKSCSTGEVPQTATAYFTKLFTQATQLYNQAKKNSVMGKSDADSIFGSASDRTKAKAAATKGLNALSALKGAKFCFTYTNTAKKSNNLAEALNVKKIKSDEEAATAMATLYTAFEQGVNDIKQATVDRGKHTSDIDTAIDSAVADVTTWFESMASAGATKTGQTIESSATEVDTSACENCTTE